MKLLKLVQSTSITKGLFSLKISDNFSFFTKLIDVKISNHHFLSVRKTLCCDVINIPPIEDRLQIMRVIFEPFIFKTAHKNYG